MAASEIKLLHLGIGFDFAGQAFLEDAAVVHHRHALDHAQRDVHVVLDDDVADMRRQRGQDLDQLEPLGRREPCGRLVEQDEARRAGERERDLELALLAVGEFGNALLLHGGQMHGLHQRVGRHASARRSTPGRSGEKRPRETPQQAR